MQIQKKSSLPFVIGSLIIGPIIIFSMFNNVIASTSQIPWFLIGIYLVWLIQSLIFYIFWKKIILKIF